MKTIYYIFILLLILTTGGLFAQDNHVVVEITSIKSSAILVMPPCKILNSDTMDLINIHNPTNVSVSKGFIVFKADKVYSAKSFVLVSDEKVVNFKVNNKNFSYCGSIYLTVKDGRLKLSNTVGIEEYVRTVLVSEFTPNASIEAIKAQSVAVRTYVFKKIQNKNYHLCDTTHCQTYKGYVKNILYDEAIQATYGLVMTYGGSPISAMYCTDGGGATQSWKDVYGQANFPYLSTVKDPFPINHKTWRFVVSDKDLSRKLGFTDVTGATVSARYLSGRVKTITFKTAKGNKSLTGEKLRVLLGNDNIKSTLFSVENKNNAVIFTGKGYGHGFGMCQRSCIVMAEKGWDFKRILTYFYLGITFSKI